MTRRVVVVGRVFGYVRFPEHPEHQGFYGLVGGEDASAERASFRSVNEAARWCRRVLAGEIKPRWTVAGDLLTPHTGPSWSGEAQIQWHDQWTDTIKTWWSRDSGKTWEEQRD